MFRNNSSILCLLVVLLACLGTLGSPSYRTFNKRGQVAARKPDAETWSNAERLARGLTPRKPGSLYNPSRVARTVSQPSGVPTVTGNILVRKTSNSATVGYIRSTLHSSGRLTVTSSTSGRLPVKFVPTTTLFQVEIDDNGSFEYLGFVGSTLASNNNNRASIGRTNTVPYGSTPSNVGNSLGSGGSESYVWYYNLITQELTAQWVNPSGNSVTVYFYYEDSGANTGLHVSANSNLSGGFDRVQFYRV